MEIQHIKQISITDYLQQQAPLREYKVFTIGTALRCVKSAHHPSKSIQSATSGTTSARVSMATSLTLSVLCFVALSAKPSGF